MSKLISLREWMEISYTEGTVSYQTVANWARDRVIPATKIGGRWYLPEGYMPQQQVSADVAKMLQHATQ
jgi:hypothetical protein